MRAIFLDRDGTINVDTGHVHKISDFKFENNVIIGLKILQDAGFSFFIVTNQSGIGKGYYSENDFKVFNQYLINQLYLQGINIKKTYFCPYHPTDGIGEYKKDSPLRKPRTGMLEQASQEFNIEKDKSWMIGDKWSDIKAGNDFGIKSILLKSCKNGSIIKYKTQAKYTAQDFFDATNFIIKFENNDQEKNKKRN